MEDDATSSMPPPARQYATTSPYSTFPLWAQALTQYSVLVPEDLSDAFVRALAARTLSSLRFSDHATIRHVIAWFSDDDLCSSGTHASMLEFICEYSMGVDSEMSHLIDYVTFTRKLERLPVVEAHGLLGHLDAVVVQRAFLDLVALLTVAALQTDPDIVKHLTINHVRGIIAAGRAIIMDSDMGEELIHKTFLGITRRDGDPNTLRDFLAGFVRNASDEELYRLASSLPLSLRIEVFKLVKANMNVTQLVVEYI
jgi:hypothetical protein